LKALHQFHSGSAVGDAVTNSLFMVRGMLRDMGFESNIYVQHVAPELRDELLPHMALQVGHDDGLFVHHSMGHDLDEWILALPCRTWLVYHNITPVDFFPLQSPFRHYADKGLRQLSDFHPKFEAAIAVSDLNRDELVRHGYEDPTVIPLLMDVGGLIQRPWNADLTQAESCTPTVLFVGRIAPNKAQVALVQMAAALRPMMDKNIQLVLVGGFDPDDAYVKTIQAEIDALDLGDCVRLTNKVSDADLYGWYRAADVFVCLSEHEGFGVPLIEAMAFGVPVIALDTSNVGATMGGAGILIGERNPHGVAALVKLLLHDRPFRRQVVDNQNRRLAALSRESITRELVAFLHARGVTPSFEAPSPVSAQPNVRYQIEGPFESSYSLALVNRQIGLALERAAPGQIALFATEGPGDYEPDVRAVRAIPGLETLWRRSRKGSRADVVIRDLYPPRVSDMDGRINLMKFFWEESAIPPEWIADFNRKLDGMLMPSTFVAKTLRDSGASVPLFPIPLGADHIDSIPRQPYTGDLGRGFRFLHVSSCFPRKGVDVLLEAYARVFSVNDEVTLVVKTFPNPHNTVAEQIRILQGKHADCPRIVLIDEDMMDSELKDLYLQCDVLVCPTRGEGFGLPMAEAMWLELPVIVTGHGGHTDFCTPDTAWLVDYAFAPSGSHLGAQDSVWVTPDTDDLARAMRAVLESTPEERSTRTRAARALMTSRYTWDKYAEQLIQLESTFSPARSAPRPRTKLAWVSSWNTKCGIATYSSFLLEQLDPARFEIGIFASSDNALLREDEPNVRRSWTDVYGTTDRLADELEAFGPDIVVVQHNFSFLPLPGLAAIISAHRSRGVPVFLTLHSTKDMSKQDLRMSLPEQVHALADAYRILVHSVEDLNRLKQYGLVDNVALFPHGVMEHQPLDRMLARQQKGVTARQVIATYGFMLPHKGLEDTLESLPGILSAHPDTHLLMVNALYPNPISQEVLARCEALIKKHKLTGHVTLITAFLDDADSLAWLDCADLVLFPYQNTAESASGAVRYGLATSRPVVCTPLPIFADVAELVHSLDSTGPDAIARGVKALLDSPTRLASKSSKQLAWLHTRSWPNLGNRLAGMLEGAITDQQSARLP